jgi:hypothetical protein
VVEEEEEEEEDVKVRWKWKWCPRQLSRKVLRIVREVVL